MEIKQFQHRKAYLIYYGNERDRSNVGRDRQRLCNYAYVAFYEPH